MERTMDEEQEFAASMAELDLRMALTLMENQLTYLKEENRRLKESLQEMCMNESATVAAASKKKKKWSQETIEKWKFYHDHKEAVRAEKGLTEWREIKRETDARYAAVAASTSQIS